MTVDRVGMERTDEELVEAYRTGAEWERSQIVDELFRRHQPKIVRWCWRFTRDREQASDLAQEILLRAFRNLDNWRGDCRFSTWLYVIARNLSLTAIQKRSTEPVWVAKTMAMDLPDRRSTGVHDRIESEQVRMKSWRFILDTLDQTEARVMLLHYGKELSLSDVSRVLGLTNKSGAKAYIVSARRKLSAAMERTPAFTAAAAVGLTAR